jgi:radical SAM protein with 4Fe4S-binding SPASM domain
VVDQLKQLGTREITFIGGEAYLYKPWLEVVRAASSAGMLCTMTSGGRALDPTLTSAAAAAGLHAISVSIDGLEPTHDRLRSLRGSFRAAMNALEHIHNAGIQPRANTQLNRLNLPELEPLAELLFDTGIRSWQVQLTGAMGRAADHPDWLIQPYEMLEFVPRLAQLARRGRARGCKVQAGNNLGYFGPYEKDLRRSHWKGCTAGVYALGIESDGGIKGCPSLPSEPYIVGNVRDVDIATLWNQSAPLHFVRERDESELWGYCARCYYAPICRGGCSWTAHTLLGRRGNMPHCYHRASELKKEGVRERIVQVETAAGKPFDFGRFELVEEPIEAPQALDV